MPPQDQLFRCLDQHQVGERRARNVSDAGNRQCCESQRPRQRRVREQYSDARHRQRGCGKKAARTAAAALVNPAAASGEDSGDAVKGLASYCAK